MLKSLTIKNFQSMVNVNYKFHDGLNVIIADNNTGKSIIFKMIEVLVNGHKFNSRERKEYIRFGCEKSDVFVESDEGYFWAEIKPTTTHYYSGPNKSSLVYEGTTIPSGMKKALGLLICEDGLIGNVIDDNQSKFLIDSDAKVNNSILGVLTKREDAEKVIDSATERIRELNSEIRIKSSEKSVLLRELSNIEIIDVSMRETLVKDSNVFLTIVDLLIGIHEKLSNINIDVRLNEDSKVILDVASVLKGIQSNVDRVNYVEKFPIGKPELDFLVGLKSLSDRVNSLSYKELPSELELNTLKVLDSFNGPLNRALFLMRENKVLDIESKRIRKQLDDLEGEVYDCPIHGTIKFVNGKECVPYNN